MSDAYLDYDRAAVVTPAERGRGGEGAERSTPAALWATLRARAARRAEKGWEFTTIEVDILAALLDDAESLVEARAEVARLRAAVVRAREYVSSIAETARDGLLHEDGTPELYEALEWISGDARNALAALDPGLLAPSPASEGAADAG